MEGLEVDLTLSSFWCSGSRSAFNSLPAYWGVVSTAIDSSAGLENLVERRRGVLLVGAGAILLSVSISSYSGAHCEGTIM